MEGIQPVTTARTHSVCRCELEGAKIKINVYAPTELADSVTVMQDLLVTNSNVSLDKGQNISNVVH